MALPSPEPRLEILERLSSLEARVGPTRRQYPAMLTEHAADPRPRPASIEARLVALETRAGIRGARP